MTQSRCGYIAIVGRPNVGKSTLLNQLMGFKLCITSRKPQTTRHTILGIKTIDNAQCLFVDTPGLHKHENRTMNRLMNRSVATVIQDVDAVLFVVDGMNWNAGDDNVLKALQKTDVPIILVINKIDKLDKKEQLLPHMSELSQKGDFEKIVPVSAFSTQDIQLLEKEIVDLLPEADHFYDEEQITDRSERFLVSEIIREKITRQLGDEVPYHAAVEIERFAEKNHITEIDALILVERKGQKTMIIGKQGQRIKQIGEQARADIEELLQTKVMLKLWVKIKSGWSDDERALKSMGIE